MIRARASVGRLTAGSSALCFFDNGMLLRRSLGFGCDAFVLSSVAESPAIRAEEVALDTLSALRLSARSLASRRRCSFSSLERAIFRGCWGS